MDVDKVMANVVAYTVIHEAKLHTQQNSALTLTHQIFQIFLRYDLYLYKPHCEHIHITTQGKKNNSLTLI